MPRTRAHPHQTRHTDDETTGVGNKIIFFNSYFFLNESDLKKKSNANTTHTPCFFFPVIPPFSSLLFNLI